MEIYYKENLTQADLSELAKVAGTSLEDVVLEIILARKKQKELEQRTIKRVLELREQGRKFNLM
jgi:uncharacterized lipoprotein YehR (DUF1307 family)